MKYAIDPNCREFVEKFYTANPAVPRTFNNKPTISLHNDGLRFASPWRLKFNSASTIVSKEALTEALKNVGITDLQPTKASGAKVDRDNGFLIEYNNIKIVILLKGMVEESAVRRKTTTPTSLGLGGKTFTTKEELYTGITDGIANLPLKSVVTNTLQNLVDSVFSDTEFTLNETIESSNFIQSDFGEVLSGIHTFINNNPDNLPLSFPETSNNAAADFYIGTKGYSVKAPNGDHINLRAYKDKITGNDSVSKFFLGCATSDIAMMLQATAEQKGICKDLYDWIMIEVNGITEDHFKQFQSKITYDDFTQWLKTRQRLTQAYGMPTPKNYDKTKELWNSQDTNPLKFAFISLAVKYWSITNKVSINAFCNKLFKNDETTFLTVYINKETKRVEFAQQGFNNITDWYVWYLGYASKAVKNWPCVGRVGYDFILDYDDAKKLDLV